MLDEFSMNDFYDLVEDNENFLVIYKKPGANFHSENGQIGLFEQVKQSQGLQELYPVHRLDKVTSGLLVMAKTASVNHALVEQFKNRQVEKYYLAISNKKPKKKQGLIKGDMESARRGAWKLSATLNNPAITQFFSASLGEGRRLFIIKPHTGKTHQIRVALKSLGSPILGDTLYADANSCIDVDRVYLHAFSLAFNLSGTTYRFTELPREGELFLTVAFQAAIQEFINPLSLSWPNVK